MFLSSSSFTYFNYLSGALSDVYCNSCLWFAGSQLEGSYSCPPFVHWTNDPPEKDLYIQSTSVTVLAMDGKRRWLDIKKQVSYF